MKHCCQLSVLLSPWLIEYSNNFLKIMFSCYSFYLFLLGHIYWDFGYHHHSSSRIPHSPYTLIFKQQPDSNQHSNKWCGFPNRLFNSCTAFWIPMKIIGIHLLMHVFNHSFSNYLMNLHWETTLNGKMLQYMLLDN